MGLRVEDGRREIVGSIDEVETFSYMGCWE